MDSSNPELRVLHVFGKMNYGGAETRTIELMPLMRQRGVYFDFCTLSSDLTPGAYDARIRGLGGEIFPCPIGKNPLSLLRNLKSLLAKRSYDIVHSHVFFASGIVLWQARRSGVPGRIVHFRNTYDGGGTSLRRRVYRTVMKGLLHQNATGILAVCEGAMEQAWSPRWREDPRTQVIYNGLDLARFTDAQWDKESERKLLKLEATDKVLINVARFEKQKAHELLLRSFSKLIQFEPRAKLLLVGDGRLREDMVELSKDLGIQGSVRFLGKRDDVPKLLMLSDLFVLTSFWEGLPGVVLEALAAGLPVVASDIPGVKEIAAHDERVYCFKAGDSDELSKALLLKLEQRNAGQASFPALFTLETCAASLFDLYFSHR